MSTSSPPAIRAFEATHTQASGTSAESFSYDDAIVRKFLLATLAWGTLTMVAGVVVAAQLVEPRLLEAPWLAFGRLRPLYINAAVFAFAGNAAFAAIYYSTQRLCKARMFSDTLSFLHFWGWQAIMVAAGITLPLGITQGKELAELEWPIDLAIAVVWIGFFGVNFFGTLSHRRERRMYVSLWFYIVTIVTVGLVHIISSLAIPVAAWKSYSVYAGLQDALVQSWYSHNLLTSILIMPFLGLMYYFLPKAAERPVYSYRLAIIHFWSLLVMSICAAPSHYTALPDWVGTLGMVCSLLLWMPSWGGLVNGLLTLRGGWQRVSVDPVLKFFVAGLILYGLSALESAVLSLKSVSAVMQYTEWSAARADAGTLGWSVFMTFGMAYWLLPRLFQVPLWSSRLAAIHFLVGTVGIVLSTLSIYAAGLSQGMMWMALDETGRLQYPDFVESVTTILPLHWVRLVGAMLFLVGMVLCGVNAAMTWRARPKVLEVAVHQAAALSPVDMDVPKPVSRLSSVVRVGDKLDIFIQGWWHRKWERSPFRFTVWVIIAVVGASLVSALPVCAVRSESSRNASPSPYTPLELAGRDIYIAEGCRNCHSQMVRSIWAETKRYGDYSKPGEFVHDHPVQWGSRRIGPDLAREGGKQSHDWHVRHLENPRQLVPRSIMPAYPHLLAGKLDFESIQRRVRAMGDLGVPYGDAAQPGRAASMAREQAAKLAAELVQQGGYANLEDKEIIALVAYLQRLGTGISTPAQSGASP